MRDLILDLLREALRARIQRARGGQARAARLSPSQRTAAAKKAAKARWYDLTREDVRPVAHRPIPVRDIDALALALFRHHHSSAARKAAQARRKRR